MKYGLLYYKDTDNIGDDIQSYAASKFLPKIDYMIDREDIMSFVPNKEEYVYTIMNAWYIHDKFNFGFSPYIYPKLISMHFNRFDEKAGSITNVNIDYLNEEIQEYLKEYGPVGARDYHTKKILDELKIENYFSACMTLTIPKFKGLKKENYICAVNLDDEEINKIKKLTNREIRIFNQDIPKGSISNKSWDERKKAVETLLKTYQMAHMVITTKLHCALPCLALGVPVLLLYESKNEDRIGTFREFVNYMNREDFLKSNINIENPKNNPKNHLVYREKLIEECNEFIKNSKLKSSSLLPKIESYKKTVKFNKNYNDVIIKHYNRLIELYKCTYNDFYGKNMELKAEIKTLKNEIKKIRNETKTELTEIVNRYENSTSWKFTKPFRKISNLLHHKK